jgi:hypothetical protein
MLPYEPTGSDGIIQPAESTLGYRLFAALWNIRPVLANELGERIGIIIRDAVISDLRDAFLQLVDPSIPVSAERIGKAEVKKRVSEWRSEQIARWQEASGRVLEPELCANSRHQAAFFVCVMFTIAHLTHNADWDADRLQDSEMLIGAVDVRAAGPSLIVLHISDVYASRTVAYPMYVPQRHEAIESRGRVVAMQEHSGRIRDLTQIPSSTPPMGTLCLT